MKTPHAAKSSGQPAKRRRPRRSPEEITKRLLEAAVQEFTANGYTGARTAAIAQRAGVVEALLFKYFGTKANLFQRAIFETLDQHYTRFVETHPFEGDNPGKWLEQAREYIGQQQDFLRENSGMFMSLIVQEAFDTEGVRGIDGLSGLQEFLDKMSTFAAARGGEEAMIDAKLTARISFGSLLACVLFRDWLFPQGLASDQKIKEAVINFVQKGADVEAGMRAAKP